VLGPEAFAAKLVSATGGREQCPLASGPWGDGCLDCTLSGNGTCVLACGNCGGRAAACDLAACSEGLSLDGKGNFLCADGSVCPRTSK